MFKISFKCVHVTKNFALCVKPIIKKNFLKSTVMVEKDVVIVSYVRTPIGKAQRGSFKDAKIDTLLAPVVNAVIKRARIRPCQIEECVFGNVLAPSNGFTEARMVVLDCGVPVESPLMVVNRQCASGLDAINCVASKIRSGHITMGLAGGFELMSQHAMLKSFCVNNVHSEDARKCYMAMGMTSEELAKREGIQRKDADYYACESQLKACGAAEKNSFAEEIVPIVIDGKEISADDGIRKTDLQGLAGLKPAFKENGVSTAGNSSQMSDAAAAIVLMERQRAYELEIPVLGTFVDFVCVGCDPAVMGVGPCVAIPKLLERNNLRIEDVDVFEINEAFSVQALYCAQRLEIPEMKVNLLGGAVALGHPLGCTGTRLVGTLLNVMHKKNFKIGVVALCVGTGMGAAALIRRD
jgi:acetyl-CoA acyltransferase 1